METFALQLLSSSWAMQLRHLKWVLGISEEYFSIEKPFTTIGAVSTCQHKLTQNR